MSRKVILPAILACFITIACPRKLQPVKSESVPIYRVP